MKSVNPANEETLAEYAPLNPGERDIRIGESASAYESWRRRPIEERAACLRRAAAHLREAKHELAKLVTQEMGKPIRQSEAEVEKSAVGCEYYAEHGESFVAPQPLEFDGARTYLRYDPIGPVLAVMPWNFPLWQVFRFAAPTLLAGNVALLKHASNVSGCALAIERIFRLAEFPPSTFTTLLIGSNEVADVIAHPAVRAVTLTGSDAAGRSVSRMAGEHLKKSVLELGGSDPFIVLADADVESTARSAAQARTLNSGQSCIAAKRFIVHESIADAFAEAMVAEMRKLRVGDPLDNATDVGPLARADLRDDLHDQVERSVQTGAKLLTGGRAIESPGFFYEPAVVDRVTPGMAAFDEETFGPVAAIIRASDDDEAIELANRSAFGLGASVWSRDVEHAERLTPRIDSGMVFVNEIVKSDPRLPFGGVKDSGYGRELSNIGIREFTNVKTVWVNNRA